MTANQFMENMPPFLPGLDLNRMFFQQVIKPLMDKHFPDLPYSAGIVGEGSDVMRFDSPQSMDHNWGPHVRIFLTEEDMKNKRDEVDQMFRKHLPLEFMGFPTNFTDPNEEAYLVQQMKPIKRGPVNHMIRFYTISSFFQHYLGFDPHKRPSRKDWLTFPQQCLIEVTAGEIFHDGIGVEKFRQKFQYFPEDVWLYMYMIQWGKIGNIEGYMARSGEMGDELGSTIIANNIISSLMELCFLLEMRYMPYPKWFGTGFSRLKCANELTHIFLDVVHGKSWPEREKHLERAYAVILRMHNELKITRPFPTEAQEFEGVRRYKVMNSFEVYRAILEKVDSFYQKIRWPIGAIDQFVSHTKLNRTDYIWRDFRPLIR